MNVFVSLLVFSVVITVVVVIHEGGHFWVGRWCGVIVKTFSVGFGPALWRWSSPRGCSFRLSALPLGGYVEFAEAKDRETKQKIFPPHKRRLFFLGLVSYDGTLSHTPPLGRICVALAGPVANILLAWLLLAGMLFFQGQKIHSATIGAFASPSPAQEAGLLVGDTINAVDRQPVEDFQELVSVLKKTSPGSTVMLRFERGTENNQQTLPVVLGEMQGHGYLGIMPKESNKKNIITEKRKFLGVTESLWESLKEIGFLSKKTANYLFNALREAQFPSEMVGPVGIAHLSGQVYQGNGISGVIWLTVVISLGLGLFNLLPLPILDGGHVLYGLLEWITGRSIPPWIENLLQWLGVVLLVVLLVVVTYSDVMRMIGL